MVMKLQHNVMAGSDHNIRTMKVEALGMSRTPGSENLEWAEGVAKWKAVT